MATQLERLGKTGLRYLWGRLKTIFVRQESGKGLSTNDLTDALVAEINKVASLESTVQGIVSTGGEANVIEGVTVNGTDAAITAKKAVITVPTKVSDLTNDSGFLTAADIAGKADAATVYTKTETDSAISTALAGIAKPDLVVVTTLPETGEAGKFYLVPNAAGSGQNAHDEFIWVNKGTSESPEYAWELLGTMAVDLAGYVREEDIVPISTEEIDEILAS